MFDSLLHENEAYSSGRSMVCGVDEVGRGVLAGNVLAAAVILPRGLRLSGVTDSKKLTARKREDLADVITRHAISIGIGIVEADRIDEINILQATFEAMRQAISKLGIQPDMVLVDGNFAIPGLHLDQKSLIGGDSVSHSIAAASIVAKVTRDRMMVEIDREYPGYGFAKHKGYGTAEHLAAIKKLGVLPIHRKTFRGVL